MRLTVRRVIEIAALYPDAAERKREYPDLEDEDVRQALRFASSTFEIKSFLFPMMRWLLDQGLRFSRHSGPIRKTPTLGHPHP